MVILFGSEKGGTGKSTLACNVATVLAQTGRSIVLVDADKQGSSRTWAQRRHVAGIQPDVPCLEVFGERVKTELRALEHRFETIVVDAGGRDSVELRAALLVASLVFVPVQPAQLDLWTIETMDSLVKEARKLNKGLLGETVINRAPTHPSAPDTTEAIEALADFKAIPFTGLVVSDRAAIRRSIIEGRAVSEFKPSDLKAKAEIDAIFERVIANEKSIQIKRQA